MKKEVKAYMCDVVDALMQRYHISEEEAKKAIKKSFLYNSLINHAEETLHDDIETNADLVYQDIFMKNKEELKMETGTIKWYNPGSGYGFITKDKGGDIFFHISAVKVKPTKRIDTGRGVSFIVENNKRGEIAKEIELTGMRLSTLKRMWKEKGCSIRIGRNSSDCIGYKIVDDEDKRVVLGQNFELSLPDVECYYYA